ncbi:MAG TPA: hypothetical protein RMG48_14080, partial [Myxococcales bacterium LLY-WYZ-16_1]|nr:hypothetical protein [Myxococcales bacterium LLY-WYZ-16_1]
MQDRHADGDPGFGHPPRVRSDAGAGAVSLSQSLEELDFDRARGALRQAVPKLEPEAVPLECALGRTPALEVRPRVCLPATPLARWAGFAVPSLSRQTLRLRAAPPEPASRLQSAHAAVVSALAPVPPGTRAVAKPGQVRRDGPEITLNEDLEPGFGLHPPGSLARPDQVLAGPERPLSLGDLERLADLGFKELRVRRVPRVGWAGRGGPSAGALLGHTGVSWVRERSFEWTQDLPELEPLDARIWVGVTPPPDARVVPSTHSGCLQPFW